MDEQLINKAMDMLSTMAEQLGTTSEYLWSVLVRQGTIGGISRLVLMVLFLVFVVYYLSTLKGSIKLLCEAGDEPKPNEILALVWVIAGGIVSLGALAISVRDYNWIVSRLLNPEYWALTQIMALLN